MGFLQIERSLCLCAATPKYTPHMYDGPNKGAMKSEIRPHLFAAKRGYGSKKRLGGSYSVASPQAVGCLSATNYFCPPMMLCPLSVSSTPCNRSRWPPQTYVFCKHPIFAVFFRYVLFPIFVQKNMFALNETNVYRVCCTPVDMRQGILRLCQFVRGNDFNPSDGCVYVFYNRPRNRIKLLHWERCGFVVYHKQMAQGCLSGKIMQQAAGFYELRWDELVLYMEGINPRCYRRKRYNKP